MAINAASKFLSKTSNLLKVKQKTKAMTNDDWDWDGVNAINIYTLVDPVMGNYDATAAANRYGTPSEVQDTIQNFPLVRDRAWTKVIDKKNFQDTMLIRKPGAYLAQATKNVMVPEMDTYIIASIVAAGTTAGRAAIVTPGATTAANAYTNLLALNAQVTDDEAPESGRVAAMTATYYNYLKQGNYIVASEQAMTSRHSGDLGEIDGLKIVIIPSTRMATATDLVISHPDACVAPEKLIDYTLHHNAPGYSGDLLEYRHRYDAFIDNNLVKEIGIHKTA